MYPSDISYNAYKYSLPEFDSQSTEASHSSFAKSRDSFFPSAQSKESANFMRDSNYFSQRDPFYPRENFHFPRDSRRKNLFCKEEEQWEPEISKKLCLEDGFRNKTTSFIDRKEMFNENSNVIANTTINFSNVNSLMHFQRKTPSFYNVKFLEQNCDNEKSFSENNLSFSNKNSRGLKYLSIKVRELVMKKKETSYKDIADQLLREMRKKNTCLENDKEVQNIKRRIYDALNVLVATDIFKKKGKTVVYDGKSNFMSHELLNKRVLVDKAEIMEKIVHLFIFLKFYVFGLESEKTRYFNQTKSITNNLDKELSCEKHAP